LGGAEAAKEPEVQMQEQKANSQDNDTDDVKTEQTQLAREDGDLLEEEKGDQ